MPNTTRTEIPAEINNFYSRMLLERAVPLFLHHMFGQIRDILSNSGTDTIKFRRYGSLGASTTALTEGTTPAGKQLAVTDITTSISRYGDFVTLTDKVLTESIDPVLMETAEVLGEQAGDSLDQIVRDVLAAGTNVQFADGVAGRSSVAAANKLDTAEIRQAVRTLKGNNAKPITNWVDPTTGVNTTPLNRSFVAVISPEAEFDLKGETGFVPVEKYPTKDDVMPGEVGALDNVRFLVTSNAKVFTGAGSGGIDVHAAIIFGQNAYGVTRLSGEALRNIIKPLGSAGTADPLEQRSTSGWKATIAASRLNENFMLRIEHAVS